MPVGNADFYFSEEPGQTDLYVMPYTPPTTSLGDWLTLRRLATELVAPNEGLYSVSLDQAHPVHRVFKGTGTPASWNDHLHELVLEFTTHDDLLTAIEAQSQLIEDENDILLAAINGISGSMGGGVISVPGVLINAGYDPNSIVMFRGATWSFVITKVTLPPPVQDLIFTLRKRNSDDEDESIVLISRDSGLLISNGMPALDPTLGSLAIGPDVPEYEDTNIRDITVTVHSEETQNYPVTSSLNYDLKTIMVGSPVRNAIVHSSQKFVIAKDVTRRIN